MQGGMGITGKIRMHKTHVEQGNMSKQFREFNQRFTFHSVMVQ
jgi:uncharacterized protein YukJ